MPERTVLAIGLDAADPPLIRNLLDRGELPTLARLEREGTWGAIRSPARLGSGAPWPTFYTGKQPEEHGVYSTWVWDPAEMRVRPVEPWLLRPFWESDDLGAKVGVLDVPTARPAGLERGFEVSEWGPHDPVSGRMTVAPSELGPEITEEHPFSRLQDDSADEPMDTEVLMSGSLDGAERRTRLALRLIERQRPDLAIVVFTEIHHASHALWHTVEPEHPLYQGLGPEPRSLLEVYRQLDRQVGRLLDAAPPDWPVAVFSLHGMRAGRGVVKALHPVLTTMGYTAIPSPRARGPSGHARAGFSWLKGHLPAGFKRLYHRHASARMRLRTAQPTMMPSIDWSRTRAFSLASADQHGDVRVNLRGREARGIVAPEDYEPLLAELTAELGALERDDGEPLVDAVIRVGDGTPPLALPDLIVHWSDAAAADPLRVDGLDLELPLTVKRITGQHRAEGFFLLRGFDPPSSGEMDPVELKELLISRTRA